MASTHTFRNEDANYLAQVVSALVAKDLVLGRTVRRDLSAQFAAKKGATINVRIPAAIQASSRALDAVTALTKQTIVEGSQPVALTNNEYSVVTLSDEDLSLRVEDYAAQVLAPQALAIAEAIENRVVAKMQSVTETAALDTALDLTSDTTAKNTVVDTFITARKLLRDQGAPETGLYAAVSTTIYSALLRAGVVAGNNGGQGDALANATIGRVAGFTVVESNRLGANEAIWYHRDAFALVLRAPAQLPSLAFSASEMVEGGVPVRILRSFDDAALAESSIVNVFSGTATLNAKQSSGSTTLFALRVNDGAGV